ncbi:probable cytochrome P450 49a1 [Hyalella azteca]|uniref:Probable cytochrome P450 49a1 n=1 Tax=Hyalella azteca TaxID=294128 RepID=A0A979FM90_HYAAZ|nr:probable cytochrome P450 49a1 [Hyalella azteca]
MALVQKYGIVKLQIIGMPPMVCTTNPDDIEVFLKSTLENPIRIGFACLKSVRLRAKDNYFNKNTGLLSENGDEWWRLRSRVQVPLLRPKNVAMYLPAVDGATNKFLDRIDLLQAETGQVPSDFMQEIYKWALECIGLVALNRELGCLEPNISPDALPAQLIRHINGIFSGFNGTEMNFPFWKYFRTPSYTKLETSHAAALELTAGAIREAQARLEEAKALGDPNRQLTVVRIVADLYISIMETLLNTEGLSRSDVATMIIDMLFAGVDTTLAMSFNGVTSRMEEYFPQPLEFLPQRWQRDRPYGAIHPFASLPFSHGTRICIGKRLAEQEMYTIIIRMLQKYTVTFESDEEMKVKTQLVLKPATQLAFKFHPRN